MISSALAGYYCDFLLTLSLMFGVPSDSCLCLSSPQGCASRGCGWSWYLDTGSGMINVNFSML